MNEEISLVVAMFFAITCFMLGYGLAWVELYFLRKRHTDKYLTQHRN